MDLRAKLARRDSGELAELTLKVRLIVVAGVDCSIHERVPRTDQPRGCLETRDARKRFRAHSGDLTKSLPQLPGADATLPHDVVYADIPAGTDNFAGQR
jgi:hypothetical protein